MAKKPRRQGLGLIWLLSYVTLAMLAVIIALNVYVALLISTSPNRVTKDILCVSIQLAPKATGQKALKELHLGSDYCASVRLSK